MSKTPIAQWKPTYRESVKLAWKPIAAYAFFVVSGFLAFFFALIFAGSAGSDRGQILLASFAGLIGIFVGQGLSLTRLKTIPVFVVGGVVWTLGFVAVTAAAAASSRMGGSGEALETLFLCVFFFCIAIPSGLLSLQHRYELAAAFWPAVGWIGSVIVVLESKARLANWEKDKVSIWTPIPLALLAGFVLTLMIYLASKQTMRIELWQALSGATERRVSKRTTLAAVPKKNLVPLLVAGLVLFGFTAILAPYLWRTEPNKGKEQEQGETQKSEDPKLPNVDGDALMRTMQELAQGAEQAAKHLWPLLFLLLFYRPAKRALLQRHLLRPMFPTPPSERVDNLWEYVRIAAEDAGVVPGPSDSVEELVKRILEKLAVSTDLDAAAAIYTKTRYGFVVEPGAAAQMKVHAVEAARELRAPLTLKVKILNQWRPLS